MDDDGFVEERWCPHCHQYVPVDEDDCCVECGTST
jgi:hypothetical protein